MYKLNSNSVLRLADNAYIPLDPGNSDYVRYLEWKAVAGNIPAPQFSPAELAAHTVAVIATRRYQAETSGIVFNDLAINTERDSQGLINGAVVSSILDPAYVCRWKTPVGFVELGADTLKAVGLAVRAHVQACFDREAVLTEAVDAGTFFDAMLEEGWPA